MPGTWLFNNKNSGPHNRCLICDGRLGDRPCSRDVVFMKLIGPTAPNRTYHGGKLIGYAHRTCPEEELA